LNKGKFIYLAFVLVAVFSASAGFFLWQATQKAQPPQQATLLVLPEAREIPAFSLVDQDGAAFGLEQLKGKWSLLFFGFTHCPDICPGTLYELSQLDRQIAASGGDPSRHQVLFVSVDPERDTPQRLKDYVAYFSPEFIAVTGEHGALVPLTRKLGIAYRIAEHEEGAADYSVDHSASILLVNPDGRLHGVFPSPHDVPAMADEMQKLLN
jgi:protein SCO1/2